MTKMCAECASFVPNSRKNCWSKDCWCDKLNKWVAPESTKCYEEYNYFCEAYNRSSREIDNAIRGISDGCFIVTMTCELLGKEPEQDVCLQKFKNYKRNYLMKQEKLYDYLMLYEDLGPAIAHKIKSYGHGARASIIAKNLYYIYFAEIIKEIDEGNNLKAFKKYVDVVRTLSIACGFTVEKENKEKSPVKTIGTRI